MTGKHSTVMGVLSPGAALESHRMVSLMNHQDKAGRGAYLRGRLAPDAELVGRRIGIGWSHGGAGGGHDAAGVRLVRGRRALVCGRRAGTQPVAATVPTTRRHPADTGTRHASRRIGAGSHPIPHDIPQKHRVSKARQ